MIFSLFSALSASPRAQEAPGDVLTETPLVPSGAVEGRVVDRDGKTPVAGAVVRLHHLDSDEAYASDPTDAKGRFRIPGLPVGYFDVSVETSAGFFAGTQVVAVRPGEKIKLPLIVSEVDEPSSWWSGSGPGEVPGVGEPAVGSARVGHRTAQRSFWKSPAGIAIATSGGVLALLAIAAGGSDERNPSPSTP